MKRNIPLTVACLLGTAVLLTGCGNRDYKLGVQQMDAGQYEEAVQSFSQCPDYKDAAALANECTFALAQQYRQAGDTESARALLESLSDSELAAQADVLFTEMTQHENYETALAALEAKDYQTAYDTLTALGDYEDAPALLARFTVEQKLTSETVTVTDSLNGASVRNIEYLYDTEGTLQQIHSVDGYVLPSFPAEVLTWGYAPLMRSYATDEFYTYDDAGRLTAITGKDNGSVVFNIVYEYDEEGRVLQEDLTDCAQISREADITHYHYDEADRLSYLTFDSDSYKRADFTYDENGTLTRLTTTHLMFPVVIDFSYENGQLHEADITRAQTGMGMQPYRTDICTYNEDGTLAAVSCTWADGVSDKSSAAAEYLYGPVLTYHAE